MRFSTILPVALALVAPVLAEPWFGVPAPPQPSQPACSYACPPLWLGIPTSQGLSCKFGLETCTYDTSSGALKSGNMLCPHSAERSCFYGRSYKREDNLTASLARSKKRAAAPAASGPTIPDSMRARSSLRKRAL